MKLAIGSDHAAYDLKTALIDFIQSLGHQVDDVGTDSCDPVDYPDFAEKVALAVKAGSVDRGIMLCGSGVGACVTVNKFPGIRGGICHDHYSAHQGVEHDHMNVLVMGGRIVGLEVAKENVEAFINAKESKEERHLRRLKKVQKIEERYLEDKN